MMTKSCVASIKYVIISRLELMAAVLAINMSQAMRREMDILSYPSIKLLFRTDSQVELGYIQDKAKRVQIIRDYSMFDQ